VTPEWRAQQVKLRARGLGFDDVGICHLGPLPHADVLKRWLASGFAGTMRYLHRQAARRLEPATILPGATRAVVVTRNYFTPDTPPAPSCGHVAKYARGRDYHEALRPALDTLADHVRSLGSPATRARAYVDAGPVPERELAQRAGLGWIGKNTMLLSPRDGSFFFLAVVLTDLDLAIDAPFEADRCGSCRRCLDACPTDAFPEPRVLDSRRCISYLSIEYRAPFDEWQAAAVQSWIFGCDVCQDVCPWNVRFARPADDPVLAQDAAMEWLELAAFADMSEVEFQQRFAHTPLSRPGLRGMRRNARGARAVDERA
jgi:epoxyqueuosine reductase